ncbi:MAG: hypothetical protein AB7I19_08560 [Planctomycetota bacterium]
MGAPGIPGGGGGVNPGGANGGVPSAGGGMSGLPAGPMGMPMDFRRQETAKSRLTIDWNLPVYAPDLEEVVEEGRTTTGSARRALPREQALAEIRAKDHRPLLVVRECDRCAGTDDALLDRRLNNEKTLLLTRWFHCVKLPNHVLESDHPFRRLFDEEHPPHLFLCRHDGSDAVPLYGGQTQAQLWEAMEGLIRREYAGDPAKAVRGLLRILNEYDTLDGVEQELRVRIEDMIDRHGPDAPRVLELQKKLVVLERERKQLEAREKKLAELPLKPLPTPATKPAAKTAGE